MKRLFLYTIALFMVCLASCSKKELVEYYERPDWLKGNSWEVLEDRGQFSLFLEAAERAGFREVLDGKTIATIYAPQDEVFEEYLAKNSWGSVKDIPLKDLKKLIGYHLVYYSYSTSMFQNYQPNGSEAREPNRAGLYYKHRTRSSDSISMEMDQIAGKERKIFNKDRFIPVLSNIHFQTKGIDALRNYEYFFGADSWKGDDGFNVANAGVLEYGVPTDNGYIYIVDEVLEPLKTIYETVEGYEDYREFLTIYDRFRTYSYDEETSQDYGAVGDSLYSVSHGVLPPIASEWTSQGLSDAVSYFDLAGLTYRAYSVFAPNNQALKEFFNTYLSEYYSSLEQVDFLPLLLLMYNHVYQGSIVFPDEIGKNADIKTAYGTPIIFNPDNDVKEKAIASNGAFYGLDKALVPDMFNSVTGAVFRNPKYKTFMYMLYKSGLYETLASKDIEFTLFIPTNEVIEDTFIGDSQLFWTEGNPKVFGDEEILVENSEGLLVPLSENQMETFVSDHIVYDAISSLSGKQVYRTRNAFNYIFVKDGKVYSSSSYNSSEDVGASAISGNWYNGASLETQLAMGAETRSIKFTLIGAESSSNVLHPYAEFSKLLAKAGLMEVGNSLSFLFGNRFVLFAPDNETVLQGIEDGVIPTEKDELADYVKSYFVSVSDNSLGDYPFPGFNVQGTWDTALKLGDTEYRQITLHDRGTRLELEDLDGSIIPIQGDFPQVFSDGAVYRINKLLKR